MDRLVRKEYLNYWVIPIFSHRFPIQNIKESKTYLEIALFDAINRTVHILVSNLLNSSLCSNIDVIEINDGASAYSSYN